MGMCQFQIWVIPISWLNHYSVWEKKKKKHWNWPKKWGMSKIQIFCWLTNTPNCHFCLNYGSTMNESFSEIKSWASISKQTDLAYMLTPFHIIYLHCRISRHWPQTHVKSAHVFIEHSEIRHAAAAAPSPLPVAAATWSLGEHCKRSTNTFTLLVVGIQTASLGVKSP